MKQFIVPKMKSPYLYVSFVRLSFPWYIILFVILIVLGVELQADDTTAARESDNF